VLTLPVEGLYHQRAILVQAQNFDVPTSLAGDFIFGRTWPDDEDGRTTMMAGRRGKPALVMHMLFTGKAVEVGADIEMRAQSRQPRASVIRSHIPL